MSLKDATSVPAILSWKNIHCYTSWDYHFWYEIHVEQWLKYHTKSIGKRKPPKSQKGSTAQSPECDRGKNVSNFPPRCKSLSVSEFRPLRGSAETAMTSVVDRVQIRWLLMLHSDQSCPDTPDSPGSKTGIHPLSAPLRVFEFAASLQFGKHLRPPRNAFFLELYWG